MPLRAKQRWLVPPEPDVVTTLPVPFYSQQQSMWCWAACAEMVIVYYNTAAVQQCDIVNYTLTRNDCCTNPGSGWCNTSIPPAWNCGIYTHFGVTNCAPLAGAASFQQVQGAIGANRVLEALLTWTNGGAHVVLVIGYSTNNGSFVLVSDPGFGGSMWVAYLGLLNGYGLGYWTGTWALWV